ncbi:MAG: hypothetical protein CSA95_07855 [Bacteroidetes bacterium]|nr:MAG: hypothetical protein CSA95_07855 [Bacteroidota bacterium]
MNDLIWAVAIIGGTTVITVSIWQFFDWYKKKTELKHQEKIEEMRIEKVERAREKGRKDHTTSV